MFEIFVIEELSFPGTPGVGKSHLCAKLSEDLKLKYHDISAVAKDQGFVDGHDEEYDCPILDEDKVSFSFHLSKYVGCHSNGMYFTSFASSWLV